MEGILMSLLPIRSQRQWGVHTTKIKHAIISSMLQNLLKQAGGKMKRLGL